MSLDLREFLFGIITQEWSLLKIQALIELMDALAR